MKHAKDQPLSHTLTRNAACRGLQTAIHNRYLHKPAACKALIPTHPGCVMAHRAAVTPRKDRWIRPRLSLSLTAKWLSGAVFVSSPAGPGSNPAIPLWGFSFRSNHLSDSKTGSTFPPGRITTVTKQMIPLFFVDASLTQNLVLLSFRSNHNSDWKTGSAYPLGRTMTVTQKLVLWWLPLQGLGSVVRLVGLVSVYCDCFARG